MMSRNCWGVWSRDCAVTVALSICPGGIGCWPNWPAATSVFCAWIAEITSPGISEYDRSRLGSSQMRIAYSDPNTLVSPTPGRRSEEHTSELQSLMRISYAVFCLKKKKKTITHTSSTEQQKTSSRRTHT